MDGTSPSQQWQISDITSCPLCLKELDNPKSLPCFHSFCVSCLQSQWTEKQPGDQVECTVCWKTTVIPDKGCDGFPDNSFVKSLIDAKNAKTSFLVETACESCYSKWGSGPSAIMYCMECKQTLCEPCGYSHSKSPTGPHRVLMFDELTVELLMQGTVRYCTEHTDKVQELHCFDCKTNICVMCFAVEHQQHKCQEIGKTAGEFMQLLDIQMAPVLLRTDGVREEAKQVESEVENFHSELSEIEKIVNDRSTTVKRLIFRHEQKLIRETQAVRSEVEKETENRKAMQRLSARALESFGYYYSEFKQYGRPADVTGAFDDFCNRASELLETCVTVGDYSAPKVHFLETNFNQFENRGLNFVGSIHVGDIPVSHPFTTEREEQLESLYKASTGNETELQRHLNELKEEIKQLESTVKDANEKLQKACDLEIQLQAQLKEIRYSMSKIQEDATNREQQLQKQIKDEKDRNSTSLREATKHQNNLEQQLKEANSKISQLTAFMTPAEIEYLVSVPRVVHTLTGSGDVDGVTLLNNELFVLHQRDKDQIEVYSTTNYSLLRQLTVDGLKANQGNDMTSCAHNRCLYLSDWDNRNIMKLGLKGELTTKWTVSDSPCGLSVTTDRNLLVAFDYSGRFSEFTANGKLLREIKLQTDIECLWHAIRLSSDQFVVCHGCSTGHNNRVCIVDTNGRSALSYGGLGGEAASGLLQWPWHLAVDTNGFIFVADMMNHRVLLLSPTLKYVRDIMSTDLLGPKRLYLDSSARRLYIGNCGNVTVVEL